MRGIELSSTFEGARFERLVITSELPKSILIEFLALCAEGKVVSEDGISIRNIHYKVEQAAGNQITVRLGESKSDLDNDEELVQPVCMFLAATMLKAEVQAEGRWKARFPNQAFIDSRLPLNERIADNDQLIHSEGCLTLKDLTEIHSHLVGESRPASQLLHDTTFCTIFPAIQTKWGEFGFVRHRSGTEVRTTWRDKEFISGHGYESPNPCETLVQKWREKVGLVPTDDTFRKYKVKKWLLSKMLNKVPAKHKQRVYSWVVDTTFDIEDYHDSRGGKYLPETLECEFDSSILAVDRNLNFELVEC